MLKQEKCSILNNGNDQIDMKKLNRGKKFSKLYNFSKYDRRFFNKMKLWIKSEINLTRANFLSTIFHSFSTNDLLYENDIIEPLSNLLSKLNENSPVASSKETRNDTNNCQDNYFVRNFKLFRIALMNVDRKCNEQYRVLPGRNPTIMMSITNAILCAILGGIFNAIYIFINMYMN